MPKEGGIYRKVMVRMWADAKVMALSRPQPCGQVLWIHLLAGEQTDVIPGLFKIGEAAFAEQLGWSLEGMRDAFREVMSYGLAKADWKARLVFVPKAINHNPPQSINVVKSWVSAWERLPECDLKVEAWHTLKAFLDGMPEAFGHAFLEACPKPCAIQEQEQEQEQKEEAARANGRDPGKAPPVQLASMLAFKAALEAEYATRFARTGALFPPKTDQERAEIDADAKRLGPEWAAEVCARTVQERMEAGKLNRPPTSLAYFIQVLANEETPPTRNWL